MPEILETDICVIGAGSGGLSVAAAAAGFGVPVVLIEKGKMGGDCLNYGCVPSKALIAAARRAADFATSAEFGVSAGKPTIDFARVRVARREQIDVAEVVAGAVRLALAHPDRPEGVSVSCVAKEGEFIVEGDDDLLHRAVFNLLLNALQASPEGSEVQLEVTAARPDQLDFGPTFAEGGVAISVLDAGPGILPSIRDRLFDPFFTTKQGGSGLGLAVVHRAIDAHRGLVFLDSGSAGTRFTVVLPRLSHLVRRLPVGSLSPATVLT